MSFANKASNLLTNKYFLYFIVFLAVSNILGYLVTNKLNAVIFFALVGFIMSNFSKNMAVILLVSLIATNLLMANKTMREGLENKENKVCPNPENPNDPDCQLEPTIDKDKLDPEMSNAISTLEKTGNVADANTLINNTTSDNKSGSPPTQITDSNNLDLNKENKSASDPEPVASKKSGFHNPKGSSSLRDAAPVNANSRIDYASTLEGAYDNLDKILGSDGINKLTGDTQKLMSQQQKLFDTMQNMAPMLEDAKKMLAGFDLKELGNLANLSSTFASAPTAV